MGKWYGKVGYVNLKETIPGIWEEVITEKTYSGDLLPTPNSSSWTASQDSVNDNWTINNRISILADPFAYQNFHTMKYVEFMDAKWKITKIDVQRPRLILTVGGIYNG